MASTLIIQVQATPCSSSHLTVPFPACLLNDRVVLSSSYLSVVIRLFFTPLVGSLLAIHNLHSLRSMNPCMYMRG